MSASTFFRHLALTKSEKLLVLLILSFLAIGWGFRKVNESSVKWFPGTDSTMLHRYNNPLPQKSDSLLDTVATTPLEKPQIASGSKKQTKETFNGVVDLNQADLNQLTQIKGIGAKTAQAILDYRIKNARFNSVSEIINVKGIGPKKMESIQKFLAVNP